MFGLFSPRCPLNIREKTWVELRMKWLVDRLGFDRLQSVDVITPSDKHFPDSYSGSDQEVEHIFGRVCDQMGVPRESVELALFDGSRHSPYIDDNRGTPLGLYEQRTAEAQRHTVWIERTQTPDLVRVIATAAHELAHCILLGDGLLTDSEADHEFVTDLLPVVRGLGVFAANATLIEESYQLMRGSWRTVSKAGYLPSRMFGYALAVFAWLRDEPQPIWARYLRGDPHSVFKSSLRYLRKTNDCVCRSPAGVGCEIPRTLHSRLTSEIPGITLGALWELRRPDPSKLTEDDWEAVVACLDGHEPVLVCETALAIAALRRSDAGVASKCLDLLVNFGSDSDVLAAGALALSTQKEAFVPQTAAMETTIDELLKLLKNESQRVVISSLTALKHLEPNLDFFGLREIIRVFRLGLVKCDHLLVMHVANTLHAVCESARDEVQNAFADDPELRSHAYAALSAEIEEESLITARLPTSASLPVPLLDWRPRPLRLPDDPEPVPGTEDAAP